MRIVRFHEFGGPEVLKFEEVATPDPKDGEVLIRTEAIGVNFTDIARRKNSATLRERLALPYTPGVEAVGTVVGTGAGSAPVSIGTKVIAIVQDGAYSEYLTVPAARAIPGPTRTRFGAGGSSAGAGAHGLPRARDLRPPSTG